MDSFESYVESLPKPLKRDDQDTLLRYFYATRSEDARNKLIEHNLRLVASIVMQYKDRYRDLDDLMQVGTIELMNIIDNKFDVDKGVRLSTFAYVGIGQKIYNEVAKLKTSKDAMFKTSKINDKVYEDEKGEQVEEDVFYLIDKILPNDTDFRDEVMFEDMIDHFLNKLDDVDRMIAVHSLGLNGNEKISQKEVAKMTGLSESVVCYKVRNITNKLKIFILSEGKEDVDELDIKSAKDYITRAVNKRHIIVLEHLYGLNGREKLTGVEISKKYGYGKDYAKSVVRDLRKRGDLQKKEFNISESLVQSYINCCVSEEEIYILEHFYGMNGRPKLKRTQLAEKLNIGYSTLTAKLQRLLEKIERLANGGYMGITLKEASEYYEVLTGKLEKDILAYSYGIAGKDFLTQNEISFKLKIDQSAVSRIKTRLDREMKEYFKDNHLNH